MLGWPVVSPGVPMAYSIKYKSGAKDDKEQLQRDYGAEFAGELERWLQHLCDDSESREHKSSASLDGFREDCRRSWAEFRKAGFPAKLSALWTAVAVLASMGIPRNDAWFRLLGIIPAEIQVVFAVDHANQRLIFHLVELSDHETP